MKPIVVPVNFSIISDHAARYAADLAAAIGGKLHLFHVLQIPPSFSEYPMPESAFEALRDSAAERLDLLAADLVKRTASKVPVVTDLKIGSIDHKLRIYCDDVKPFLIIMGAAGSPLDRFLSGSATLDALKHLAIPLLVVPESASFYKPGRILLACDLEDIRTGMADGLGFLRDLKELFGSQFEVVNVTTPGDEGKGQAEFAFSAWRARLRDIHPELHFVHNHTVSQGVEGYLKEHPADWLVVFPKKHSFYELHKSRTRKIVLQSHLPVMSIHE
ncbi:MAG TPA: universal stress protein [Puia sp.]|nr:universal stress protein [Puia sp.]